jgi:large subunit ribosomal protein L3
MLDTTFGLKGRMGQAFIQGSRVPVTKIQAEPCVVTGLMSKEKNGYWAVQLGYGTVKNKKISHFLREIRTETKSEIKIGDQIKASDIFSVGDVIAVTGVSKGKGFAGGVKRWHFKGGSKTHGQSDRQRAPGSIGSTTTPGRVLKGKHMAGRMGGDTVTVKNLHVISVDPEKNEFTVSGQIPGKFGDFLKIRRLSKGSLKELEHKAQTQVVEGEVPAEVEEKI